MMKLSPEQEEENRRIHEAWEKVIKISAWAVIESVEHRTRSANPYKRDPDKPLFGDNVALETVDDGWYIRIAGSSAIYVGERQPPSRFKKGARIKLSLLVEDTPKSGDLAVTLPKSKPPVDHAANYGGAAAEKALQFRGEITPSMTMDERERIIAENAKLR